MLPLLYLVICFVACPKRTVTVGLIVCVSLLRSEGEFSNLRYGRKRPVTVEVKQSHIDVDRTNLAVICSGHRFEDWIVRLCITRLADGDITNP